MTMAAVAAARIEASFFDPTERPPLDGRLGGSVT
jgi:hypothetical protein